MGKVNEFQAAWAEGVGLELIEGSGVTIKYEGKTLGEGRTVLDAVLDAFTSRRKTAEILQSQLGILLGLGKDPEQVLSALDELFPTEEGEDEEDEYEEDDEDEDSVRVIRR